MALGMGAVVKLQPILFGKGEDRGLVVFGFPEDAQKRGEIFLFFPHSGVCTGGGVGLRDTPRLGPRAKSKIV